MGSLKLNKWLPLRGEALFMNSSTILFGDSQQYWGKGPGWGADVRHYLRTLLMLGELL